MDRERVSEQTMTGEYIRSVAGTRRVISNVLNILSQQERTMRSIVANERRMQTRNNATNQLGIDDFITLLSPSVTPTPVVTPAPSVTPAPLVTPAALVTPAPVVTPAPSVQEINYATREVMFSTLDNPINNVCPISRESFSDDEIVMQIIPCGHIFSRDNLRVWFMSSVNCPMCRYDIRNYRTRANVARETRANVARATRGNVARATRRENILPLTNTNTSSQSMGDIANFITTDILRQLEATNANDSSNNLLFEYTLLAPDRARNS